MILLQIFVTDDDTALLKCKLCRESTAQIRVHARSPNLHSQILDSILSYVNGITYAHKANAYNHVKPGVLQD